MTAVNCPFCPGSRLAPERLGRTSILRCRACGLGVTPPPGEVDGLDGYYRERYRITSADVAETERRRWSRLPEQVGLIADLARWKEPPARLLDIGCDKGFFLDEARRHGYDVAGVEPSREACEYCGRIGLTVWPDLDSVLDPADIVTLWHSLEHLADPADTLARIRSRLSPGGLLAIRVPDAGSLAGRLLADRWIWFQPHHHLFHYTARALRRALEASGFQVLSLVSRHANGARTRAAHRLAGRSIPVAGVSTLSSLRRRAGWWIEQATGVELYALARRGADDRGAQTGS